MKKLLSILAFFLLLSNVHTQQFEWAGILGGRYNTLGLAKTQDQDHSYLFGVFNDSIDLNPGTGELPLLSDGASFFLVKLDHEGELQWGNHLPAGAPNQLTSLGVGDIALTSNGEIMVGGYFTGIIDTDPGEGEVLLTTPNDPEYEADAFLAKYHTNGDLIWSHTIVAGEGANRVWAIATDNENNIIVAGNSYGVADFDPSENEQLSPVGPPSFNIFLAKYSSNGDLLWVHTFTSEASNSVEDVLHTENGEIYLVGSMKGDVDFSTPGSSLQANSVSGPANPFVAKFQENGEAAWAFACPMEGTSTDFVSFQKIQVRNSGSVFVTGSFAGTNLDLDPDPGQATVLENFSGESQGFLAEYDSDGDLAWHTCLCSGERNRFFDFQVVGPNQLLLGGSFRNTFQFPGTALELTSNGPADDLFVALFDLSQDEYLWAFSLGGLGSENLYDLHLFPDLRLHLTGITSYQMDFDLTEGSLILIENSVAQEYFLAEYDFSNLISSDSDVVAPFNIHIYPNPAPNQLFIQNEMEGTLHYELFSPQGQLLRRGTLVNATSPIDLGGLPSGPLLLQLTNENKTSTWVRKIVKLE